MKILIKSYNAKKELKYWDCFYIDSNFLLVEIIKNGLRESYFYNSMEG